jgi:hypothetical protein
MTAARPVDPASETVNYAIVPHSVLDDDRLEAKDLLVWIAVRSYDWGPKIGKRCIASIRELAKRARVSERSVQRALLRLIDFGHIEREKRSNAEGSLSSRLIIVNGNWSHSAAPESNGVDAPHGVTRIRAKGGIDPNGPLI